MRSIHGRVFVAVVLAGLLVFVATAAWTFAVAHREIDAVFDAQLVAGARTAAAQFERDFSGRKHDEGDDDDDDEEHDHDRHRPVRYEQDQIVQIFDRAGALLYHSKRAPSESLGNAEPGFSDQGHWRVYTLDTEDFSVRVAQDHHAREHIAAEHTGKLIIPLGVALPFFVLVVWIAVRAGLRPLDRAAAAVARREPGDFAPLGITAPSELQPLVDELDKLLVRLGEAFARERRFTADAAHELRTPLAAIKAHAQVALAATQDEERRHAVSQVSAGADRATRLVEQLLLLARAEAADQPAERQPCDLAATASEIVAAHADMAARKGVDLGLAPGAGVTLPANRVLLDAALRNLVDNAVRYTPKGGRVDVTLVSDGAWAELRVDDAGPGIPESQRGRVLERFARGETEEPGSGLGLSIVKRIAALHGGELVLEPSALGGLRARLRLPLPVPRMT